MTSVCYRATKILLNGDETATMHLLKSKKSVPCNINKRIPLVVGMIETVSGKLPKYHIDIGIPIVARTPNQNRILQNWMLHHSKGPTSLKSLVRDHNFH